MANHSTNRASILQMLRRKLVTDTAATSGQNHAGLAALVAHDKTPRTGTKPPSPRGKQSVQPSCSRFFEPTTRVAAKTTPRTLESARLITREHGLVAGRRPRARIEEHQTTAPHAWCMPAGGVAVTRGMLALGRPIAQLDRKFILVACPSPSPGHDGKHVISQD